MAFASSISPPSHTLSFNALSRDGYASQKIWPSILSVPQLHCSPISKYVGVVDVVNRKGTVELGRYKKDHPFAQLSGSDNIIAFTTERYNHQPLIVRGPGAGAQVTAGGVFSDILRLASYLGAPS